MNSDLVTQALAFCALFIAGQGTCILLLLFSSPERKNLPHTLLAVYIAFNCSLFILEYFIYSKVPLPGGVYWLSRIYILEGGLFYLYVKALVRPDFRLRWQHGVHLLPLLVFFPYSDSAWLGSGQVAGAAITFLYYLFLLGYCLAAARLMPEYRLLIRGHYSSLEGVNLEWLYKLIIVYALSSAVFLLVRALELWAVINDPKLDIVYINNTVVYFVCFYLIAIGGYRQKPLQFDDRNALIDESAPSEASDVPHYHHAQLDDDTSAGIWQNLTQYMSQQRPFLEPELSLQQLAEGVGVSPYLLSQVLNRFYQQSFYDFVNGYRAEEARGLIVADDRPELSMLDIGFEAGFSSKATFYKYFKKLYSTTPLQYKKSFSSENSLSPCK